MKMCKPLLGAPQLAHRKPVNTKTVLKAIADFPSEKYSIRPFLDHKTVLSAGVPVDGAGGGAAAESEQPPGGDGLDHHEAAAGAAGQGQHRGDAAAADQDEDVHEPHHAEEPHDGRPRRPARWGIVHGNIYKSSKMILDC